MPAGPGGRWHIYTVCLVKVGDGDEVVAPERVGVVCHQGGGRPRPRHLLENLEKKKTKHSK